MTRKRPTKTAAELMAELQADAAYREAQAQRRRELNARTLAYRSAEEPIVGDLRAQGTKVSSVWDLVNTNEDYREALPILLSHLSKDYPDRVREGIARALAIPAAIVGWKMLISEYEKDLDTEGLGAKSAIALALSVAATSDVLPDVIRLLKDPRQGKSRGMLLLALKRLRPKNLRELIGALKDDPDLAKEIRSSFRSYL